MKHIAAFIAGLLFVPVAFAAPIPGTATSKLVAPELGLYRSADGFTLNAGTSGWNLIPAPQGRKHIAAMYSAKTSIASQIHADLHKNGNVVTDKTTVAKADANAPSLTVRVDNLKKPTSIDKYVGKWMREYPRYGFDVLGSKSFALNKQKGYVLDLVNRDQGKQLRQVVFVKNQKAVILTCHDSQKNFASSLKSCNQIIRTFNWM